ncbi:TonB family protein [Luteimonas marina]|uniref:Protein TonB n=1 Tax=Luteimonas marina TaxID=488485 RepID=A0A5C5UC56_9GAMM|nr:energy transducer TonB [Luteimonas marina]TWT23453.1 TonB family protein [Luteimonas marina]
MSTPPVSPRPPARFTRFLPSGRAWWLVAGAFLAGLLLFALVLSGKRDAFEFYRADGDGATSVEGQVFEPLPAPLPAGEDAASGMDERPPARTEAPRIDQHASSPGDTPSPAPATAAQPGGAPADASLPRPLSSPPPDYPAAALRAGASGNVVLRIEVGADGRPGSVEVVAGSRNRQLDRAAVRAVRRWRFQPAMRDGVAVPATVQQTISFDAPR